MHAIAESSYKVVLPEKERAKFKLLEKRAGPLFSLGEEASVDISDALQVNHERPATSIGGLERLLIFPRMAPEFCRQIWPAERPERFSFQGQISPRREEALAGWLGQHFGLNLSSVPKATAFGKLREKALSLSGAQSANSHRIGELILSNSKRGRKVSLQSVG